MQKIPGAAITGKGMSNTIVKSWHLGAGGTSIIFWSFIYLEKVSFFKYFCCDGFCLTSTILLTDGLSDLNFF